MSFLSDECNAELREVFFTGAEELLQALNEDGLALEERPGDAECVRRVRRAVHTLKGDSAACGFRELSELAHELEDVLTPELAIERGAAFAELILTAADTFHAMLAALRGKMQPPDGNALRTRVRQLLKKPSTPRAIQPLVAQFAWSEYERLLIAGALERGEAVHNLALEIEPASEMPAAALVLIRKALAGAGTILAIRPAEGESLEGLHHVEAALASTRPPKWIEKKCRVPGVVAAIEIRPVSREQVPRKDLLDILLESEAAAIAAGVSVPEAESSAAQSAWIGETHSPGGAAAHGSSPLENTLRVEAERVDSVMNLVGEMIIGKSMLHRAMAEFDQRFAKDPLRHKLADALAFQARVLDELQKSVMKIRMVPVEQLFRRFPRVVRDVAKLRRREIALEVTGQSTDLDKGILDALAEPLAHLVRNAADHGIESPEERAASGKPPRGAIRLNAYHQGNQVVIEVSDDGRGIDREKLVRRAIERGLLGASEAAQLSEDEKIRLIFQPGLSTADEITEISGRGVGMDVVETALEKLKGTVGVESEPGKGTRFLLTVPLTLASIQALLFQAGGRLYAVPLDSVMEITRASEPEIHRVDDHEILRLRNQVLTLVRVERLSSALVPQRRSKHFIIVVGAGNRRFGLVVDTLLGEEELVIKALEDPLVASDLASGASILGDGTVVLILNVPAVIARLARLPAVGVAV